MGAPGVKQGEKDKLTTDSGIIHHSAILDKVTIIYVYKLKLPNIERSIKARGWILEKCIFLAEDGAVINTFEVNLDTNKYKK